jgi:uncharacterized protein YeeX (DUF496 family)
MSDLGNMMHAPPANNGREAEEWKKQKREFEAEIQDLNQAKRADGKRIAALESDLKEAKEDKLELEAVIDKMSGDYAKLRDDHEWFVDDYENQKLVSRCLFYYT